MPFSRRWLCLLLVLVAPLTRAAAAEESAFKEGRFEKGELKYVHGLPVLILEGTPAEMGRQEGRSPAALSNSSLPIRRHC